MIMKIVVWIIVFVMFLMIIHTHLSIIAAQKLHGTVVGYIERKASKGRTVYALRVEYIDLNGKKHQTVSSSFSSFPDKDIGDSVIVLKPYGSMITQTKLLLFEDLFYYYWLFLYIFLFVGTCLVGQDVMEWLYL